MTRTAFRLLGGLCLALALSVLALQFARQLALAQPPFEPPDLAHGLGGSAPIGQLSPDADVAVAPDGTVYALDGYEHRLTVYAPSGAFSDTVGSPGSAEGQLLDPTGVAAYQGQIAVADQSRFQLLDGGGRWRRAVHDNALDLAYLSSGELIALLRRPDSDELRRYDRSGDVQSTAAIDERATRVDAVENEAFVLHASPGWIGRYSQDGRLLARIGDGYPLTIKTCGAIACGQSNAKDVAVSEVTGPIYAINGAYDLLAYTPEGAYEETDLPGFFESLTTEPGGSLLAAGSASGGVTRLDPADGAVLTQWGASALGPGVIGKLVGVDVAVDGQIWTTARAHTPRRPPLAGWIHGFEPDGRSASTFEAPDPRAIAVTIDGRVLVADAGDQVRVFSPAGDELDVIPIAAHALAVGPDGEVAMARSSDGQVEIVLRPPDLNPAGQVSVSLDLDGNIMDIALSRDLVYLLIGDRFRTVRVSAVNRGGEIVATWGAKGARHGEFVDPNGIAIAADGSVLVADTGNFRIQVFESDGTYRGNWVTRDLLGTAPLQPLRLAVGPDGKIVVGFRDYPRLHLYAPSVPQAWRVEIFDNSWLTGTPQLVSALEAARVDWGQADPAPGVAAGDFSSRIERVLELEPGPYNVEVQAAGGARLWLGNRLLIDAWHREAVTETLSVDVEAEVADPPDFGYPGPPGTAPEASDQHRVRLEYRKARPGAASVSLRIWAGGSRPVAQIHLPMLRNDSAP